MIEAPEKLAGIVNNFFGKLDRGSRARPLAASGSVE